MTKVTKKIISENSQFPNNPYLPVLHYHSVFNLKGKKAEDVIKKTYIRNGWHRPWVDSIYDFHHYHSNNHEVLGIAKGYCIVLIGGEEGHLFKLLKGDALILPAGVSHKRMECSDDFSCVGGYSLDEDYDMKLGKKGKKIAVKTRIHSLPLPSTDPIFGTKNPLLKFWKQKSVNSHSTKIQESV